jgi:hypothetical protein
LADGTIVSGSPASVLSVETKVTATDDARATDERATLAPAAIGASSSDVTITQCTSEYGTDERR